MRFTATVKNREVVIRDVQLPDGELVDVTLESRADEWEPTPAELREMELGDADVAAGRVRPIGEVLERLRRAEELRAAGEQEHSGEADLKRPQRDPSDTSAAECESLSRA